MGPSIVFMFSGQGSQYYQMGRGFYEQHPVFRKWMVHLDELAQDIGGVSVIDTLYNERNRWKDRFMQTEYTHPAIFMVEYALAQVLIERGIEPDYVLGASLGEFTAATLAGVTDYSETLEAVIRQAQIMASHCPEGGMIAVIHDFRLFRETPLIYENSELAAVNAESHFILSGENEKLAVVEQDLKRNGIIYQKLPVSFGFHSSAIDPAEPEYRRFLKDRWMKKPQLPIVSGMDGTIHIEPLPDGYGWDVIRKPIRFPEAVRTIESEEKPYRLYVNVGPDGSLANIAKKVVEPDADICSVLSPYHPDLSHLDNIRPYAFK